MCNFHKNVQLYGLWCGQGFILFDLLSYILQMTNIQTTLDDTYMYLFFGSIGYLKVSSSVV